MDTHDRKGPRVGTRYYKILAAIWYCAYWAGLAAIQPYFNVFFQSKGVSEVEIGIISAVRQWVMVPASFAFSAFADYTGLHRFILLATLLLSTATRTLLYFGSGFAFFLAIATLTQILAAPVTVLADTIMMSNVRKDGDYGKIRAWGALGWGGFSAAAGPMIAALGYLSGFIASAALTLPCAVATRAFKFTGKTDAAATALAEAQERADTATKAWEAHAKQHVDVALVPKEDDASADDASLATERCVEPRGSDTSADEAPLAADQNKHSPADHASTPAVLNATTDTESLDENTACTKDTVVTVAPEELLRHKEDANQALREATRVHELTAKAAQMTLWQRAGTLLRSAQVWLLLYNGFLQGYGLGLYQSFLFIDLESLGGSQTLMGLTITVDCLAEFPAFWFKEWFFKYISVDAMLHISVLGYALRLALYALLPYFGSPCAVLPIQLLHGLTYAWGWGAGTVKSKHLSPPGLQATMQGMFQGAYMGAGAGVGSLVGGVLVSTVGMQWMWGISSLIVLAGWGVHVVAQWMCTCVDRRRARTRTPDDE